MIVSAAVAKMHKTLKRSSKSIVDVDSKLLLTIIFARLVSLASCAPLLPDHVRKFYNQNNSMPTKADDDQWSRWIDDPVEFESFAPY